MFALSHEELNMLVVVLASLLLSLIPTVLYLAWAQSRDLGRLDTDVAVLWVAVFGPPEDDESGDEDEPPATVESDPWDMAARQATALSRPTEPVEVSRSPAWVEDYLTDLRARMPVTAPGELDAAQRRPGEAGVAEPTTTEGDE